MKSHQLTHETAVLLGRIEKWLKRETDKQFIKSKKSLIMKTRILIDRILVKGYYSEEEKELLNELRRQYIKNIKNTKQKKY